MKRFLRSITSSQIYKASRFFIFPLFALGMLGIFATYTVVANNDNALIERFPTEEIIDPIDESTDQHKNGLEEKESEEDNALQTDTDGDQNEDAEGSNSENPYTEGFNEWYVFERRFDIGRPIKDIIGSGSLWLEIAMDNGYKVDNNPLEGAISFRLGSLSGLGIVEKIDTDGSIVISTLNADGEIIDQTFSGEELNNFLFIHDKE